MNFNTIDLERIKAGFEPDDDYVDADADEYPVHLSFEPELLDTEYLKYRIGYYYDVLGLKNIMYRCNYLITNPGEEDSSEFDYAGSLVKLTSKDCDDFFEVKFYSPSEFSFKFPASSGDTRVKISDGTDFITYFGKQNSNVFNEINHRQLLSGLKINGDMNEDVVFDQLRTLYFLNDILFDFFGRKYWNADVVDPEVMVPEITGLYRELEDIVAKSSSLDEVREAISRSGHIVTTWDYSEEETEKFLPRDIFSDLDLKDEQDLMRVSFNTEYILTILKKIARRLDQR